MKPSGFLESILRFVKKLIPSRIFSFLQPLYHYLLSFISALLYRFPSRHIHVIAITGTKGKTSTAELVNAILEEAGYATALSSTLRFKVRDESENNTYKMTLPGRFFLQQFLRKAVRAKCEYAIIEMTSESVKQFRHKFVELDALIFTNIAREHIESHGSFENYLAAKLKLPEVVSHSKKRPRILVANTDDAQGHRFLAFDAEEKRGFSLRDADSYSLEKRAIKFHMRGADILSPLSGVFNLYNMLGAIAFAETQHIGIDTVKRALERFTGIRGRMEYIDEGQDFTVLVDYAHTPDSLEKVYETFQSAQKICVLGGTGGGRDSWKRPEMGAIAAQHCSSIILTDEDPYDEDPMEIIQDIADGMPEGSYEIILDRREAIRKGIALAKTGDAVLITGKGTDPYIMGKAGTKTPWSDAAITREILRERLSGKKVE